jgi:beta-alanine--pyruvate transaminase
MGHSSTFSMDNQWLPFTPNRHFASQDPRVFVAADGHALHHARRAPGDRRHLQPVVRGRRHNRKPINEAIKQQLDTLDYSTAFQVSNDKAFQAAEMIAAMAPGDLNKVLFCNSGSEAADTSLKVALAHHRARGEGHRNVFIGRERGYHGVGFGGMSVGGIPANRKVYGSSAAAARGPHALHSRPGEPRLYPQPRAGVARRPPARARAAHLAVARPSNVAAIIVEPVAGSAGWYIPPQGYLKRLREICDKHGILLIFDEVITGFGRLGTGFGADFYGVVPDMLNFAKCVTNGVIPLGGVICSDRIYNQMMQANAGSPEHAIEFFHGYTYSGHPVACAAAIATLKLFEEEQLFARAGQLGRVLGDAMHSQLRGLPTVVGVRTLGLAGAVEVAPSALPGKRAYDIFIECFAQGVLVRPAGENLVLCPPYIVQEAHIGQMVDVLAAAICKHA